MSVLMKLIGSIKRTVVSFRKRCEYSCWMSRLEARSVMIH